MDSGEWSLYGGARIVAQVVYISHERDIRPYVVRTFRKHGASGPIISDGRSFGHFEEAVQWV